MVTEDSENQYKMLDVKEEEEKYLDQDEHISTNSTSYTHSSQIVISTPRASIEKKNKNNGVGGTYNLDWSNSSYLKTSDDKDSDEKGHRRYCGNPCSPPPTPTSDNENETKSVFTKFANWALSKPYLISDLNQASRRTQRDDSDNDSIDSDNFLVMMMRISRKKDKQQNIKSSPLQTQLPISDVQK